MRKTLMVVSLRNSELPAISSTEEEVVVNPNDDQGTVSDFTKPVDEKSQGFGRSKKVTR
jgi:hypothetical protein